MKKIALHLVASLVLAQAVPAIGADTLVSVGSPVTPFPQNKQNEPAVAIDPSNPMVVAAGANDEIDLAPCSGSLCPFTPGVGTSGIYFSFDGGASWTQPTYTGFSARNGTPGEGGPIGTLPNYFEAGLVSDGDPILAFGPRPDGDGHFSWGNGSRLYYANLAANFSTMRGEEVFRGFEAIAVSHADDLAAAAAGDKAAWSNPVIVSSRLSQTTFSDKEHIWADNAESSPHFGNVYVCWVSFRSLGSLPNPVMFSRSTDGGETFSRPRQISEAANNFIKRRQGCIVRTDSQGTVYVFWEDAARGQSIQVLARSFDGGVLFDRKRAIANVVDVGAFDPVQGGLTFDGIAGARTDSFLSVDIANGAPTGQNAPDYIVAVWSDGRKGLNHEEALLQYSSDGGVTWSAPIDVAESGDRPNFPWVAISPDGSDVYVTYNAFLDPWQDNLGGSRQFQGVVRHADFPSPSNWSTLHRGAIGDGRASSANNLMAEFLGDYNFIAASNAGAVAVWVDARNATVCAAVNQQLSCWPSWCWTLRSATGSRHGLSHQVRQHGYIRRSLSDALTHRTRLRAGREFSLKSVLIWAVDINATAALRSSSCGASRASTTGR